MRTPKDKPKRFDRSALKLRPLAERDHDLDLSVAKGLGEMLSTKGEPFKGIQDVAGKMVAAREKGAAIILMIGGHVIRSGVQAYLIDLMKRRYISCVAVNGACMIHDYEFSLIGATTESVARYIKTGQFGLWQETGLLNDIINRAYKTDASAGMGETVGAAIALGDFPHKRMSLFAAGYRMGVPITVHVGIGYDIIHEHPNCNGAATGALSYNDFLRFASVVERLESGVVLSFGSAVMAPEVFLKALSMARNAATQEGRSIRRFTTLVSDLIDLPADIAGEPEKDTANYFFRPWKTLLVRTVADGGNSFYIKGKHMETIPALWAAVNEMEKASGKDR